MLAEGIASFIRVYSNKKLIKRERNKQREKNQKQNQDKQTLPSNKELFLDQWTLEASSSLKNKK